MQVNGVNSYNKNQSKQSFCALKSIQTINMTQAEKKVVEKCMPKINDAAKQLDIWIGLSSKGTARTFDVQVARPPKGFWEKLSFKPEYVGTKNPATHSIDSASFDIKDSFLTNLVSAVTNYFDNKPADGKKSVGLVLKAAQK